MPSKTFFHLPAEKRARLCAQLDILRRGTAAPSAIKT